MFNWKLTPKKNEYFLTAKNKKIKKAWLKFLLTPLFWGERNNYLSPELEISIPKKVLDQNTVLLISFVPDSFGIG